MLSEDLVSKILTCKSSGWWTKEVSNLINKEMFTFIGIPYSASHILSPDEITRATPFVRECQMKGVPLYRCEISRQIGIGAILKTGDEVDRVFNQHGAHAVRKDVFDAIGGECARCGGIQLRGNLLPCDDNKLRCRHCASSQRFQYCDQHRIWHSKLCDQLKAAAKLTENAVSKTVEKALENKGFLTRAKEQFPGLVQDEQRIEENQFIGHPRGLIKGYGENVLHHLKIPFGVSPNDPPENGERLWLGVELEVEPRFGTNSSINSGVRTAYSMFQKAILKSDSSLGNGGFEIVSIPGTLNWHREAWTDFFENAAPFLRSWDTNRCGLHVHLNKAAISKFTLGKMLLFVNADENRSFIEQVAGRSSSSWAEFRSKKIGDGMRGERSHHEALSFSNRNGGSTVELRIARGNTAKNGFFRILEFANMLPDFCSEAGADKNTSSVKNLTATAFWKWFSLPSNYSRYPEFAKWARKKSLLKITSKLRAEDLILEAA